jgi:hypothetical protein
LEGDTSDGSIALEYLPEKSFNSVGRRPGEGTATSKMAGTWWRRMETRKKTVPKKIC